MSMFSASSRSHARAARDRTAAFLVFAIAASLLLAAAVSAGPAVLYVDDDAPPGGDGLLWSSAFSDLQDALAAAGADPLVDEIRIAQGIYAPDQSTGNQLLAFEMVSGVSLYGGYAGVTEPDPDLRDVDLYITTLSGDLDENDLPDFGNYADNSNCVVRAAALAEALIIDGFVIRGGNAASGSPSQLQTGAGLRVEGATVEASSCTFVANSARLGGAAVANHQLGALTLSDCRIAQNRITNTSPSAFGGAVYNRQTITLTNCVLEQNTGHTGGAFLSAQSSFSILLVCAFMGNTAESGAAVASYDETWLLGCELIENVATALNPGAAVQHRGVGELRVNGCSFTGNTGSNGAAIGTDVVEGPPPTLRLTISNSTFTGNSSTTAGGAILTYVPTSIDSCTFSDNTSSFYAGAVGVDGGPNPGNPIDAEVRDCIFTGNMAGGSGGGISIGPAVNSQIERCTFDGNSGSSGGGLRCGGSAATIIDSTFTNNSAIEGGALRFFFIEPVLLEGCTFAGNHAELVGGALRCFLFEGTVDRCAFFGNTAGTDGGAIWSDESSVVLQNSLLSGNVAGGRGGGVATIAAGTLTVRSTTIAANSASIGGGGVDLTGSGAAGALLIYSAILSHNQAAGASDEAAQINAGAASADLRYSCIQGLVTLTGPGLIGADPLFLDAPGADGTPGTEDDDLHLSAGSPCINTGDPVVTVQSGPLDLDGAARVQECRIDMGAYETTQVPPADCNGNSIADACDIAKGTSADTNGDGIPDECACAGDVDGSGAVDVDDLVEVITSWGACPGCPADIDGDGDVDVDDLVAVVVGWGKCG